MGTGVYGSGPGSPVHVPLDVSGPVNLPFPLPLPTYQRVIDNAPLYETGIY